MNGISRRGTGRSPGCDCVSIFFFTLLDSFCLRAITSLIRLISTTPAMSEPSTHLWRPGDAARNGEARPFNATIIALVRNEELDGMIASMRQLERSWNAKFNYPWTFFNDVPFTEEFKRRTQAETRAECRYGGPPAIHACIYLCLLSDAEQNWSPPNTGMSPTGSTPSSCTSRSTG